MTALQTAVLDLADARDFAFAGGKAVNLAELIGAGFPVPDGFCVGTPAYAQAAATAGLAAVLGCRPDLPARARDALLATPHPRRRRRRGHRRLPRARRRGCRSRCGRRPPPRTSRARASRASRTPTSTWSASTPCWTRCAAAGRRSGRTGPWPTAPTRASRTRAPSSPWWCSGWSTRRPRACCSPPTRSAVGAAAACSTPRPALATPSSPARSTPTTGWSTGARSPPARRGRLPHRPAGARPRRPRPPGRGALRRAAGHRVGARRRGHAVAHPVARDHHALPGAAAAQAGPARAPQRLAGPGAHPADHADGPVGVPGGGRDRSPSSPPAGPSTRWSRPRGVRRSRATGRSSTSPRCCATRSAARPCPPSSASWRRVRRSSCASCSPTEPSLAPTRSALPGAVAFARPVLRILLRYRVPALIALALVASGRRPQGGRRARRPAARAPRRAGHRRRARPARARRRRCCGRSSPIMPRTVPAAAGGLPRARVGPPGRGARSRRAGRPRGAARAAAQRHHRHGPRAVGAGDAAGPGVDGRPARGAARRAGRAVPRRRAAARAAARAGRVPRRARAPHGGGDRPRHAALVRRPDPGARVAGQLPAHHRPGRPPRRPVRPRGGRGRGGRRARSSARCGGARGCARGSPAWRCAARGSSRACARRTRTTSCGCSPTPGPSSRSSAPSWRAAVCSRPPTTSSSWSCARSRPRSTAPTSAPLVADRRAEYDRELRRRHIPRVLLSDGTEPEAEHAAPAPEGALGRDPGLGGHRHGRRAGGARPGGRPPGAGRDPRRARPPTPAGPRCSSPRAGS